MELKSFEILLHLPVQFVYYAHDTASVVAFRLLITADMTSYISVIPDEAALVGMAATEMTYLVEEARALSFARLHSSN